MIDQATIDKILDAAQIVDVVSEFVTLRKRGVNYIGLCPFHNERTPSFSVSPAKGLCKCFSCGKGGNAVHFIMEHEQLSYYEALKFLAKKYSIEVKERELSNEEKQAQSIRESMFIVNNFARDYFCDILKNHIDGRSVGLAYFRQRGFRDDTIEKFQLGFSLNERDALAKETTRKGYHEDFLTKTGLCYATDDGKLRDRFWGRVMFPVHTLSGKVVAFGGRILSTDKKLAKYVNSPESEIYHKSNELYGLYFAKQAIVKQDRCFLVEGYTDVISMHQAGIENVVASSGTSLTTGQIKLIHRFTNNITVLYDGDMAGIKASIRGIDMLLEEGMYIKVVLLPDNEDPDSFAGKHNTTDFQSYISQHESDFIHFKTKLLLDEAGKEPLKRAELIGDIVRSISVIPEAIVRAEYIKECSQLMHVEDKLLVAEIDKRRKTQTGKEYRPATSPSSSSPTPTSTEASSEEKDDVPSALTSEEELSRQSFIPQEGQEGQEFYKFELLIIQALIRYGEKIIYNDEDEEGQEIPVKVTEYIVNELKRDDLNFHNPLHRQILAEAAEHIHDNGFVAERYFMTHPNPDISKLTTELTNDRYQLSKYHFKGQKLPTDEERLSEIVPTDMGNFKDAIIKEELKHIMRTLQNPEIADDPETCNAVMQRYKEMKEVRDIISKRLGVRVIPPK
ncbi:DNA primase [termite gut metagenome]|uniref:DNA primase n=1 Tax=termite gut metagenome TaxID=433724 RepID=A0A5J4T279_9ZZZZ